MGCQERCISKKGLEMIEIPILYCHKNSHNTVKDKILGQLVSWIVALSITYQVQWFDTGVIKQCIAVLYKFTGTKFPQIACFLSFEQKH